MTKTDRYQIDAATILRQITQLLARGDLDTIANVQDYLAFRLELLSPPVTVH